jgi:hypothetical protein
MGNGECGGTGIRDSQGQIGNRNPVIISKGEREGAAQFQRRVGATVANQNIMPADIKTVRMSSWTVQLEDISY